MPKSVVKKPGKNGAGRAKAVKAKVEPELADVSHIVRANEAAMNRVDRDEDSGSGSMADMADAPRKRVAPVYSPVPAGKIKQVDLGGDPLPKLRVERKRKASLNYTFATDHYHVKIKGDALHKLQLLDDMDDRRKKFIKRVKPLPDVEEIPPGAKPREAGELLRAAMEEEVVAVDDL